jgi:hypothetical protein
MARFELITTPHLVAIKGQNGRCTKITEGPILTDSVEKHAS